jgi:hypothetical protein
MARHSGFADIFHLPATTVFLTKAVAISPAKPAMTLSMHIIRSDDAARFAPRHGGWEKAEAHMRKLTGLFLVMAFAAAVVVVWAKSPVFTKHAEAIAAPPTGLSPYELHRQIDVKSLPAQETADPI